VLLLWLRSKPLRWQLLPLLLRLRLKVMLPKARRKLPKLRLKPPRNFSGQPVMEERHAGVISA
jgi:hypothetical protein